MDKSQEISKIAAQKLQHRREFLGVSYRSIERQIDSINHVSIRRYLSGERDFPLWAFEKISEALGLDPVEVLKSAHEEYDLITEPVLNSAPAVEFPARMNLRMPKRELPTIDVEALGLAASGHEIDEPFTE